MVPEKPTSEDLTEIQDWKWSVRKAKKINSERHSLRCDIELKLSVSYPNIINGNACLQSLIVILDRN